MDAINIINKVIEYSGLSAASFAVRIGVKTTQAIYDLQKGRTKSISQSIANKISSCYPEINRTWLLTGEGDMLNDSSSEAKKSFKSGTPYYNVDFIGGFDLVINDQTINPEYLIQFKPYEKATCWCNITGHSMEPEINHGDIIALKLIEDFSFLPYGEVYAIVTTNDMRTVKRIGPSKNPDCYTLIPTNKSPEYGVQELPKNKIRYVYQVLGCMKKL